MQRVGQAIALLGVAGLLGLLVWKVAFDREGGAAADLAQGKPVHAPPFTLDRLDRSGKLSMEDLRGKAVVVNFWASWCVPCRDEAPVLQQTYERYRDQGLVVLGVDVNDFSLDARTFMRRFGLTYPVVYDGKGSTVGAGACAPSPRRSSSIARESSSASASRARSTSRATARPTSGGSHSRSATPRDPPRARRSPRAARGKRCPRRCSAQPSDLEAELVCPTCKTTLDQSDAPVARRMKQIIREQLAAGATEAEIKVDLVDQFGPGVLAEPPKSGSTCLPGSSPLACSVLA